MGCRDALTPCHYDLLQQLGGPFKGVEQQFRNCYVQLRGWKRFLLLDPCYLKHLEPYPQGHPMDRCARLDLEHRGPGCVEATLGPGDALILPAGWWHHVQSLTDDSVSISFWFQAPLTVSIASSSPLPDALERLRLARAAEALLLLLRGPQGLKAAYEVLRGMLLEDEPPKDPEEAEPSMRKPYGNTGTNKGKAMGKHNGTPMNRFGSST